MPVIDSSNSREHSYPVYGRQFKSYKWYKPIIVGLLFVIFYIVFAVILTAGTLFAASQEATPGSFMPMLRTILVSDYDSMDLANAWQSVVSLGSVAVMIPSLWLASVIVRDRPFSSYSSAALFPEQPVRAPTLKSALAHNVRNNFVCFII